MSYYLENYGIYPTRNITDVHNYWVEIFVDYGAIIFVFFISCYYRITRELINKYNKSDNKEISALYLMFIFFVFSFLIGSISSSNNLTKEWIWILAGIILAYINSNIETKIKSKGENEISGEIQS